MVVAPVIVGGQQGLLQGRGRPGPTRGSGLQHVFQCGWHSSRAVVVPKRSVLPLPPFLGPIVTVATQAVQLQEHLVILRQHVLSQRGDVRLQGSLRLWGRGGARGGWTALALIRVKVVDDPQESVHLPLKLVALQLRLPPRLLLCMDLTPPVDTERLEAGGVREYRWLQICMRRARLPP